MRNYEAMFLVESGYASSHWNECIEEIKGLFERHGCEIIRLVKWDDRKLAYPIERHKRGVYILCYFRAPNDSLGSIERNVRLSEHLLRALILRREKMTEQMMFEVKIPSGEENIIGEPPENGEGETPEEETNQEETAEPVAAESPSPVSEPSEPSGEAPTQEKSE